MEAMQGPNKAAGPRDALEATPFGRLPEEALNTLATHLHRRQVPAGAFLCYEGEANGRFCVLAEGLLKASRTLPTGKTLTVLLLRPPDSFGFLPLLDGGPLPLTVQAVQPSTVYTLERETFWALLEKNPVFALPLLIHLAGKFRECVGRLDILARPGALPRLAVALASLAESSGSPARRSATVELPVSQETLAHTLGVAPENLSRAVARLVEKGILVRLGRRRFLIPSLDRLHAIGDEGHTP